MNGRRRIKDLCDGADRTQNSTPLWDVVSQVAA